MWLCDLSLLNVERLTGIDRDVLKKWESRYGYPSPKRSKNLNRLYTLDDVKKLKLIVKLVNFGESIKSLVLLEISELQTLLDDKPYLYEPKIDYKYLIEIQNELLLILKDNEKILQLDFWFGTIILKVGLSSFITNFIPAFDKISLGFRRNSGCYIQSIYCESLKKSILKYLPAAARDIYQNKILIASNCGNEIESIFLQAHLLVIGANFVNIGKYSDINIIINAVKYFGTTTVITVVVYDEKTKEEISKTYKKLFSDLSSLNCLLRLILKWNGEVHIIPDLNSTDVLTVVKEWEMSAREFNKTRVKSIS